MSKDNATSPTAQPPLGEGRGGAAGRGSDGRMIIHIDMDAFFAAVEQLDHPELRGKPIVVGSDEGRGVVSTASYEARRHGIHSAMPMVTAKRRCPQLIVCQGDYRRYKEVSEQVHRIFHDYTDLVEPISLDEAFLDVTADKRGMADAVAIAEEIRQRIRTELQLTASAGISYCKFLAKIASDWRKPDGLFEIPEAEAGDFIARLPVGRFWGVGPKTKERMRRMGIFTGRDLREASPFRLIEVFGKMGQVYHDFARGIDLRPVEPVWVRKSVGCEETFLEDKTRPAQLTIELYNLVLELVRRIRKAGFRGRVLTLKVKYADFRQITRSLTAPDLLTEKDDILPLAKALLQRVEFSSQHPVRLLGLSVKDAHPDDPPAPDTASREEWVQGWLQFPEG